MRRIFDYFLLHPLLVLVSVGLGVGLVVGLVGWLYASRAPAPADRPTAVVVVIQAITPTLVVAGLTPAVTPTTLGGIPPTHQPGSITLGAQVVIVNTGGEGLNLRAEPSLTATILYLGYESEVFAVQDGPRQADGFTWWWLVALYDPSRVGWGVENYLQVIQNP
jgi:hypothetical protein